MDLVRPFAGTLFRAYQGLEQVPELSPNAITRQARLGVDFCLSMMKLNNLQQYRTVRYLPLADGGYGALHITVLPGYGGQPMVRAELEVSRQWIEAEEEKNNREGLFIINNRWLLEPDPSVKPSGTLVGQVGDWRLFDTKDKVFKPGKQYNGFCTQSTDGKKQHAVWVYEDEGGKKWIAENGAIPYIKPVPGNGPLQEVPSEAKDAIGSCWFWYADDALVGSYRDFTTMDQAIDMGNTVVMNLLEHKGEDWTQYAFDANSTEFTPYSWSPGLSNADLSVDGTTVYVFPYQSSSYSQLAMLSWEVKIKDKTLSLTEETNIDNWGPYSANLIDRREPFELYYYVHYDNRYIKETLFNNNPLYGIWEFGGTTENFMGCTVTGQCVTPLAIFYESREYTVYRYDENDYYHYEGWNKKKYQDGRYHSFCLNLYSLYHNARDITYIDKNSSNNFVITFEENWIRSYFGEKEIASFVPLDGSGNEYYQFPFAPVISSVTTDICGLMAFMPVRTEYTDYPFGRYPVHEVENVILYGIANKELIDLTDFFTKSLEFKSDMLDIINIYVAQNTVYENDFGEAEGLDLPIPATRGCAFSAAG